MLSPTLTRGHLSLVGERGYAIEDLPSSANLDRARPPGSDCTRAGSLVGGNIQRAGVRFSLLASPHRHFNECLGPDIVHTVTHSPASDHPLPRSSSAPGIASTGRHRDMQETPRRGAVSGRLRHLLTTLRTLPHLDEAAERMCMSSRSLRRRLRLEGTTFQIVLDEVRKELALQCLGIGTMSVKRVGQLLGFSSPGVFGRAFKSWTGETIVNYRNRINTPASALTSCPVWQGSQASQAASGLHLPAPVMRRCSGRRVLEE